MIVHVYSLSNTNQITFTNKLLHFTIVGIYKSRSLRPSDWGTELRSPKWARLLEVFGTVRRVRFFRSIRAVRDVRCSLNKCFSLMWSPLDRSELFEYPNSEQSLFRVRWTLFVGLVWSGTKYIASLMPVYFILMVQESLLIGLLKQLNLLKGKNRLNWQFSIWWTWVWFIVWTNYSRHNRIVSIIIPRFVF